MKVVKNHLLALKISREDYANLVKASELDGRSIPDFVRHYMKLTCNSIIAVRGQTEVLKLFSDSKKIAKIMEGISKGE